MISGTGPNGRIIKRDIEAVSESGGSGAKATPARRSFRHLSWELPPIRKKPHRRCVVSSPAGLTESLGPIPTFYLTVEIEMDHALELRKQVNALYQRGEKKSA